VPPCARELQVRAHDPYKDRHTSGPCLSKSSLMRRLLSGNPFLRRMIMLSGGNLLGQLAVVASSPILTRLYEPEAFGTLAVFMSLSSILGISASLRFEFGIPVAPREEHAVDLVGVCFAAGVVTTLLTALGVWLLGPWLVQVTKLSSLALLLWLLPATVLCNGLSLPLGYWSVRQGTFRLNTANKLVQAAGQAGSQLMLGAADTGASGLILGYSLGPFIMLANFVHNLPPAERPKLLRISWRRVWPLAREHWQYPIYSAPASLLTSATQLLPAVLLATLYGPAVAGWFGLGQRVMGLPVRLLAQAASQVFLGEAPKLGDDAAVRRLFVRSTAGFTAMGLVGMAPVMFLGPWLFVHVFGPAWREAGMMAALLVPQHLTRFVVTPVSQTLNIYGRQDLHLTASAANGAGLAVAFGLAYATPMRPMMVVLLYSTGTTLAYLLYLGFAWQVVRRGGLSRAAPAEAAATVLER
jgi:O-antigen/teichoic acid export membrane protein